MGILRNAGLITMDDNGNILLTESGRVQANKVYERHQVISEFLETALGVNRAIAEDRRPNADFLKVSSIIASLLLDKSSSALTIIALSDIAEFMTSYTIEKTRNSIKDLLNVDDGYVWKLLSSGELERCLIKDVHRDEKIVIHTGEKISVDGIIASGEAVIDQSSITGEFMPVIRKEGEQVFAGAIIKSGTITVQAQKVMNLIVLKSIP